MTALSLIVLALLVVNGALLVAWEYFRAGRHVGVASAADRELIADRLSSIAAVLLAVVTVLCVLTWETSTRPWLGQKLAESEPQREDAP